MEFDNGEGGDDDARAGAMRLLKDEYFFIQQQVSDYSKTCFQMKYWAITTSAGGLALGAGAGSPPALIASLLIGANVLFWMAEALWRSYQFAFQWVGERQETAFLARAAHYRGPQMREDLRAYFTRPGASLFWMGVAAGPRTSLPYALIIAAAGAVFALPPEMAARIGMSG
ncbi:MAG: hypothetical protein MI723_18240 [Caulobacterales bacterium]|nr:hypothetical protein [Caulobacterales bacterium]